MCVRERQESLIKKGLFYLLQTMHTRSHYSDYTVIATHMFKQKRDNVEKTHTSELVLIINNWHFVKDTHTKTVVPPCRPDDCSVQIKISSTVFKSEAQLLSSGSDLLDTNETGEEFFFDKNGTIIPFPAFKELITSKDFQFYLKKVKEQFDEDSGSSTWIDHEEAEEHVDFLSNVQSSQGPRGYLGGPTEKEGQEEEEEDEDDENEPAAKVAKKNGGKGVKGGKKKTS